MSIQMARRGALASARNNDDFLTTDLRIRIDASQETTYVDGNGVSQATDFSGHGNHAVQATGANQPTYETNVINSLPVFRFDGTTDTLAITNSDALALTNGASAITMIAVASLSTASAAIRDIICFSNGLLASTTRLKYGQRSTGSGVWGVSARRLDADAQVNLEGSASSTGFGVLSVIVDYANSDADIYRNGSSVASSTSFLTDGTVSATNAVAVAIGSHSSPASGEFWLGDIAELLVYEGEKSPAERQAIEEYLNDKYALNQGSGSAYWTADFEEGPSTGISGYSDWSVVQAEDTSQADPALNEVALASAYSITAHGGVCVGKFEVDSAAKAAGKIHSKVFKEWQVAGSTTKQDDFDRNLQALPASGIDGTYKAWFYAPSNYTYGNQGWTNIFQFKLEEEGPFVQDPQWWLNITNHDGDVNNPTLHVENWGGGTFTDPGGTRTMPKGSWFEIRADLYEGDRIDWYLNGTFWQTVLHTTATIGRFPSGAGTSRCWIFGVGHYDGTGRIFVDDASFTPF